LPCRASTSIGQEAAQQALKPLLGIPEDLAVIDLMAFGVPARTPYKRWKKTLPQIMSWGRFNMANYMTVDEIDAWVREERHNVM
jgi:hypothetical protein